MRRTCAVLLLASLSGCSNDTADDQTPPPRPEVETSPLAAPVTAPMRARDHLLRQLDKNQQGAKQREAQFDSLLQQK